MFSPDFTHRPSENPVIAQATAQAAGEHAQRIFFSATEACFRLIQQYGEDAARLYRADSRFFSSETAFDEHDFEDPEELAA